MLTCGGCVGLIGGNCLLLCLVVVLSDSSCCMCRVRLVGVVVSCLLWVFVLRLRYLKKSVRLCLVGFGDVGRLMLSMV